MRYSGETVDAALSKGLADLEVGRDQVEVTVISEGRKGFLGIGRKPAEVEITVLESDDQIDDQYSNQLEDEITAEIHNQLEDEITAEIHESEDEPVKDSPKDETSTEDESVDDAVQAVGNYLDDIISQLGIDTEISVTVDRRNVYFDFDTDQQGLLIGKHGRTLNALQILAQACFDKQVKRRYRLILDVGDYRGAAARRIATDRGRFSRTGNR